MLRDSLCERCRYAAFSAAFILLQQQHIIIVVKLQQPKYEESMFSGMLIVNASCVLQRPLMNARDKVTEFFAVVSQIP